jgi:hypothetical protein
VYLYRTIDQYGQVIDVLISPKRDLPATCRFFLRARPAEVTIDRAPAYPRVIEELIPAACHITEQYANNRIEADCLKARLRPMRGLKRLRSARVISTEHAFVQNLRRGHYATRPRGRPEASAPDGFHRRRPLHLINPSTAENSSASPATQLSRLERDTIDEDMAEIIGARQRATDRPVPPLL